MNKANTKSVFDIYNEFSGLIIKHGYKLNKSGEVELSVPSKKFSVYIPSIHKRYTNAAIWHVFEQLYGVVTRIDNVSVKVKGGVSTEFKSAFVHFTAPEDAVFDKQIRINPNLPDNEFLRRNFWQPNPNVRKNEYWIILPNAFRVTNTTLTLNEIASKMMTLQSIVTGEELEALNANKEFLIELRNKQNKVLQPYQDTSINIHQLARNIELMEGRTADTEKTW